MPSTLATLRKELMRLAGLGVTGNTTSGAGGAGSALIDASLLDVYSDTEALNFAWMYRANAAAADQVRRVAAGGFNISTGQLTPTRAWAAQPSGVEAYELSPLMPAIDHDAYPYSLQRAINDGLAHCYFRDAIVLGRGDENSGRLFRIDAQESILVAAAIVNRISAAALTPPAGWTTLVYSANAGGDTLLAVFWKRASLTDPTFFTFTGMGTTSFASATMFALSGVEVESPSNASAAQVNAASSASVTTPSVTTTLADAKVLRFFASVFRTAFESLTATERIDVQELDADLPLGLMVAADDQAVAGAAGAAVATQGLSSASMGATIAFAPRDSKTRIVMGDATVGGTPVAGSAGTFVIRRPSAIASDHWTPRADDIRRVFSRSLPQNPSLLDQDESLNGRYWKRSYDPQGVILGRIPSTDEEIIAEVIRPYPPLAAETDATDCPLDLALAAATYCVYRYLNDAPGSRGAYKTQLASAVEVFAKRVAEHPIPTAVEL